MSMTLAKKSYLVATAVAGITALGGANTLHAQTRTSRTVGSPATFSLAVPAGSLESGLLLLGRQANLRLLYPTTITSGKQTKGVAGDLPSAEAINVLLAGTGLSHRFTAPGTVQIFDPAQPITTGSTDGATPLQPINVLGEDAWGPVNGIVAERSATGTKTDTPLIETPQSVTVVTRKQMEWQATQEVNQALRYEPGVRAEMSVINRAQEINIRGFTADGSAQGIFLDGLSLPTSWYGHYNINPYGLERIEVLRGPASVLYGQNNPGGMVNLISKRPTSTPFNEVEFTTGTYGKLQGAFDFSGPVTADNELLYRLTGEVRDVGSQIDYTDTLRGFVAPSFTWEPDADTSFTFLSSYQKQDRDGSNDQWLPAVGTVTPTPNGRIPRSFFPGEPGWDRYDQMQAMAGYAFEHRFDDHWTVRQNLRFSHLDTDYNAVVPYTWASNPDGSTSYNLLDRYAFSSVEQANTFVIDNQVQYEGTVGSVDQTVLAGLDYKQSHFRTTTGIGFDVASIDPFNPVYGQRAVGTASTYLDNNQVQRQLGVYLQDQIKIADKLVISLGARYDRASSDTDNFLSGKTTDMSDGAFTWKAGAVYLFDNGLAPYASYSTSFFPQSGTDYFGTPFDPTTGQSYEVGVKYQPVGYDSFAMLSAFDMTKQNVLTSDPNPLHPGAQVQTGEIRSRGIELSTKAALADNLDLIAAYTFIDLETTKSNTSNLGRVPFAGVPRHMASIWADYTVDSGNLEGLGVGGGVRLIGKTQDDGEGAIEVPGVALFDAALRYDLGNMDQKYAGATLSLNATNLFDRTYVASCNNATTCFYGPGRVISASLRYRW